MFAGMPSTHKRPRRFGRGYAEIFPPVNVTMGLAAAPEAPMSCSECTEGFSMTYGGSGDTGGAWRNDGGVQPHAFDPIAQPELFSGVATKRIFAFLIDMVVIAVPVVLGYLF